jgi:hypothetical protein
MSKSPIKFVVSLAANYMTIDVMQALPASGLHGAWKQWLAYLHRQDDRSYRLVESITVQGNTGNPGLAVLFVKGLDILRANPHYVLTGAPMEVVLGPSLSRVGVVEIADDGPARLSEADRESYVNTWVTQTWKVQADDCEVRSMRIGTSARHLVTCIERYIVDVIHSLCEHEGIALRSCQPAVASHAAMLINEELRKPASTATATAAQGLRCTVFVERGVNGRRSHIAQFLVRDAKDSLSITRMWLNKNTATQSDTEVDSIIARLRAQHHSASEPAVNAIYWPHPRLKAERT